MDDNNIYLVTGGHGFIGSHVVHRLHHLGRRVRVADIAERSTHPHPLPQDVEVLIGNLCEPAFCAKVVGGVYAVLHFAANMGGMGTIREENDFQIYEENHAMTQAILAASTAAGVQLFFFASSACVYPEILQSDPSQDVSLVESDVWTHTPPQPQGLYGTEKLNAEILVLQAAPGMAVRIARFHNVFGPGGAWDNGREKAPAAMLRKAYAGALAGERPVQMEIWGDGAQRRSFLFIDDAVDAIIRLLDSDCSLPINIGSDVSCTIQELAELAVRCAGLERADVEFDYLRARPVGVASRNANLNFVSEKLGWRPSQSLATGMQRTGAWIRSNIEESLNDLDNTQRRAKLAGLRSSILVDLEAEAITFAVLLPITSRCTRSPQDCLDNLRRFALSLHSTTYRDVHHLGGLRFRARVYLDIDHDDDFLLGSGPGEEDKPTRVLREAGIVDVRTLVCNQPRGHVCALWRDCARQAYQDGCDYFVLMGDDVVLDTADWMSAAHGTFGALAHAHGVPRGFGCVAFMDTSFPGMPTFPIVHRTHLDIFRGEVVPRVFVNQDGDPYLFQLYRRWGCSRLFDCRLRNTLGGSEAARYEKRPASGWTFDTLDDGTKTVEDWLAHAAPGVRRVLTIDVIVPCYRVQLDTLARILALTPSPTCTAMFIIVVDNPRSPHTAELLHRYGHRADVRIRVHGQNRGASIARNRGLAESAAEYVLFLDDDVVPKPDILVRAEEVIRLHPRAAGFVGKTQFPPASAVFTTAVHLAGVTFFWDIAAKAAGMNLDADVPWGVTANLLARRSGLDAVHYDPQFPKTGGGEDIDYCLRKRESSLRAGGEGFRAAPHVVATHPWWGGGARSYWRFYMWSKGDGALIKMHPALTYMDWAPNSAELALGVALLVFAGLLEAVGGKDCSFLLIGVRAGGAVLTANILHDLYRHLWRDAARVKDLDSAIDDYWWVLAVVESTLVRCWSEMGRLIGLLERGEVRYLGRRFDWFAVRAGSGPRDEERRNSLQRLTIAVLILAASLMY